MLRCEVRRESIGFKAMYGMLLQVGGGQRPRASGAVTVVTVGSHCDRVQQKQ
jgi:hypothetical protein